MLGGFWGLRNFEVFFFCLRVGRFWVGLGFLEVLGIGGGRGKF